MSLLLYGLSILPFTYIISFAFEDAAKAKNYTLMFYIISGTVTWESI